MKRTRRPTSKMLQAFTESLSTLLPAGITLLQALTLLSQQKIKRKSTLPIADLIIQLQQGIALSQALALLHFPMMYCRLVAVGESSGQLPYILQYLSTYFQQSLQIKRLWLKALLYPAVIMTVAVGITLILLVFVIPKIQTMFESFDQQLPMFTQIVLNLSSWTQRTWLPITLAIIIAVTTIYLTQRYSVRARSHLHALIRKLPLFGQFTQLRYQIQICQLLHTCLQSGITLDQALSLTGQTCRNLGYQHALVHAEQETIIGNPLHQALAIHNIFPNTMIHFIAIGEDSARLQDMLQYLSDRYQQELHHKLSQLSSLLEPLFMLIMGGIVGALVIAMYLPVFNMGQVL